MDNKTIYNPIYNAVAHTSSASNEIMKETSKQENVVNKHIEILKEAAHIIKRLNDSSHHTETSARRVAEKTQEVLTMSHKDQEAVKANIEKDEDSKAKN